MRVYIPGHVSELPTLASGAWEPDKGYAVTALLLEISAHEDQELLAEQARDVAAADSVLERSSERRVVVVVDYPRADVTPAPDDHPAAVRVTGRVMPEAIVCVFIDEDEARADARKAAKGDADALAHLEQRQLLWYDASELEHIPA